MSSKDTDDVLDFINSLPDSKRSTPKPVPQSETGDDLLDFLDELSAHEKAAKPVGSSRGKFEPKKREEEKPKTEEAAVPAKETALKETANPLAEAEDTSNTQNTQNAQIPAEKPSPDEATKEIPAEKSLSAATDEAADPIASILSWWNNEGSSKVSSFWGSLTSNAHQLGETTFQIASTTSQQLNHQRHKFISEHAGASDTEQNILHISDRLNSILTTMSQQIKDGLIDKEDELLNILLVHDLSNVNYLDSVCSQKFNKVMSQVEGGIKVTVNNFNHKHEQEDGLLRFYELDMFHGKAIDGEKLCFANLESAIKDYLKITGAETEADVSLTSEKKLEEDNEDANDKINKSNIFIAIQPITTSTSDNEGRAENDGIALIEANNADSFSFTMILKDITNNITIISKTQPFPLKWVRWVSGDRNDIEAVFGSATDEDAIDPGEWVKEWLRDGLSLCFAVVAQEYVTKRMGI